MRKNLKRRKTTRKYTRSRLIYKRRQRGGQPWARNWPDPRDSLKDKFGWRKAPVTSGNPKLLDWGPLEEERFIGLPGETSTTPAHNKHKKSKLSGIHQNDAARQTAHQMVLHLLSKENQAKGTEAFKHLPPTAQEIIRYGGWKVRPKAFLGIEHLHYYDVEGEKSGLVGVIENIISELNAGRQYVLTNIPGAGNPILMPDDGHTHEIQWLLDQLVEDLREPVPVKDEDAF